MRQLRVILLVPATLLILSGLCCKDEPTKPYDTTFSLTTEDVSCTEAWLHLHVGADITPRTVELKRDSITLFTKTISATETIVLDSNLTPNHMYLYQARLLDFASGGQGIINTSALLPVLTLDSTSHAINWIVDTLGAQGVIRDVWVFSRDNAWVVGEIKIKDSTGKIDDANPYNAARWDGNNWQIIKIPTATFGGSTVSSSIYTIFAFSESNIWTFSIAGSYSHWDGTTWTTQYVAERSGGGNRLWGTSSSNLYLVGTNGSITRYNGTSWTRMTSNTTVDLEDIYGLNANHIWATGTMDDYSRSVILSFDGSNWATIYDDALLPPAERYAFSAIWTINEKRLYLAGISGTGVMDVLTGKYKKINTPATFIIYDLNATSVADIFTTGANDEVTHFNGSTIVLYNIEGPNNIDVSWRSVKVMKDFVLIGGDYYFGYNTAPLVLRGYR